MSSVTDASVRFVDLALAEPLLKVLDTLGYEVPTPIQAAAIPPLLAGKDILGQAQTGTGKTAAFALPLLHRIDLRKDKPQVLVLAPTRELAIQVSEAFQRYAAQLPGFHVLPIYGGQDYGTQIRALKRGVHVVVGTPGRVMDHMRKGTLKLDSLKTLVLDEADEMLRMGFIDDVEWVLEQLPTQRQIALFSATMPTAIRRIAKSHLLEPAEVTIDVKARTAATVRQRYWFVSGAHKLDALTRILEAETFDATIIFVRTKTATAELAEKLAARGYRTAALNGDIAQKERERTIERLKTHQLDILIATDVAARGLDVARISHVINYDIPHDSEAYVHRIGRTGRAGRTGDAILFVAPRERNMLRTIERATNQTIAEMQLPSTAEINTKRIAQFQQRISDTLDTADLDFFHRILEQYRHEHDIDPMNLAAALAHIAQGETPLLIEKRARKKDEPAKAAQGSASDSAKKKPRKTAKPLDQETGKDAASRASHPVKEPDAGQHEAQSAPRKSSRPLQAALAADEPTEGFRLEVGAEHGVKAANIIGALCNEAGLDSQYIQDLEIFPTYSTVRMPQGMPRDIFRDLKKAWVCGRQLQISRLDAPEQERLTLKKSRSKDGASKAAGKSAGSKTVAKRRATDSAARPPKARKKD